MTSLQISYQNMVETNRANLARERETYRANLAREQLTQAANDEQRRHNLVLETQGQRTVDTQLLATQNQAKYQAGQLLEANRSALANERIGQLNAMTNQYSAAANAAHFERVDLTSQRNLALQELNSERQNSVALQNVEIARQNANTQATQVESSKGLGLMQLEETIRNHKEVEMQTMIRDANQVKIAETQGILNMGSSVLTTLFSTIGRASLQGGR